ncbi:MAG TPA: glycosyltransferase family 39 protein [Thermoleophilaceae bacterium]
MDATSRRALAALCALTAAGAALRLPFLGNQSIWYDEWLTLGVVQHDSLGGVLDGVRLTEANPPLYYAVTWAWTQLVGSTGDVPLRTPAAIAGVLCVPASYLAVRRLAGRAAALAAAALCATSPVLVAFSLNARAYPLAVLFACLSLWALGRALEDPGGRRLAVWSATAALCLWTHYYTAFVVAAELAVLAWRLPAARRRVAAAAAAVAVAFAPLVPLLADQRDERASHISELDLGERVEQAVRQLAAAPNPPGAALEGAAIALAAVLLAAGAAAVLARRLTGPALLGAIGAAAVAAPLALAAAGIDDHFFMRNLLPAWPCLAAVAALGAVRLRCVPLAAAAAVGVAIVLATQGDWRHQNADWRGAVGAVEADARGLPIVVLPGFDAPVAGVYAHRPIASGPVTAAGAWVVVEPGRVGRRDLRALPGYPRAAPAGFRAVERREHRGFLMVRYAAARPLPLDPAALGPDVLGQRPLVLLP